MRILILAPVAALAACGGGDETKNKAPAAPASIVPGQYEVTTEVTKFEKKDAGAPKINTPVGTKTTRSVCVGATATPEMFADDGFNCQINQPYVRAGKISLHLACTKPDLQGPAGGDVSGTFNADSFEVSRTIATALATDGDVVVTSRLTGRRTGECAAR